MTIDEILGLDTRKAEAMKKLRKILKLKTPFFKNKEAEELIVEDLEEAIRKMTKKYPVQLSYIMRNQNEEEEYYSLMIKNFNTGEWVKTVYGQSIFEGLAKAVIYMYKEVKIIKSEEQNGKN